MAKAQSSYGWGIGYLDLIMRQSFLLKLISYISYQRALHSDKFDGYYTVFFLENLFFSPFIDV
jgi:hypothetical protein